MSFAGWNQEHESQETPKILLRKVIDKFIGRTYFIDDKGSAFSDQRCRKPVKCGLGHKMWCSDACVMQCERCDARIKCEFVSTVERIFS